MLNELQSKGINPWPHKFHVSISIPDFISKYNHLEKEQQLPEVVTLAGMK